MPGGSTMVVRIGSSGRLLVALVSAEALEVEAEIRAERGERKPAPPRRDGMLPAAI